MQKKTLLSACIALALSSQGWAADITDTESASAERKGSRVICPTDTQKFSSQELKNLPAECLAQKENNLYPWLAVGATALITTFAAIELMDDDGHHSHSSQQPVPPAPPVPPDDHVIPPDDGGDDVTPPDDGGDDVIPPDDGGDDVTPPDDGGDDVTPPDDGGDDVTPPDDGGDDVTPPDDGGDDVTPPDDGGDDVTPPDDGGDDVTPPDDGGDDVTPPDDGGDDVTPPDDGGDDVTPPDDGGDDVTPPDDGGDDVTPPDDGGDDVTPPDDGGDDVTPPDDGGDDVTPPDDGGDDVTPPDDGGDDVTPPDDGGDDVTPPDDGGDDVTPPDDIVKYENDVTWNKTDKTLQIRKATFTYSVNADGSYTLTALDGRTTVVKNWQVHTDTNTVVFDGVNTAGGIEWSYDDDGKIYITKLAGVVVDGTNGTEIKVHDVILTDQGGNTALNGGTVLTISGDNIVLNNNGKTVATGEGSVVGILTGDNITITNNGETAVDGGTAVIVNGNNVELNTVGDSSFINGGTGSLITGDDASVDNKGNMTVDGENSAGAKIIGDGATIKQEGDLYVSGGAHGIDVTGKGTIVSNKGNITVVDEHSEGVLLNGDSSTFMNIGDISVGGVGHDGIPSGVLIEGDNATFVNVGDITTSNTGIGVKVDGDAGNISLAGLMKVSDSTTGLDVSGNNNDITLSTYELSVEGENAKGLNITGDSNKVDVTGDMSVEGKNATGTNIVGNDASVMQKGDLDVSDAAHGVDISGSGAIINNAGAITVRDSDSIGVAVSGDDAQFSTQGVINVSLDSTGVALSGDHGNINLNGDVNITEERASDGDFKGATGVSIVGDDSTVSLDGSVNMTSDMGSIPDDSPDIMTGVSVVGNNNVVDISGGVNISANAEYTGNVSEISGVSITGENNTVNLDGGIHITGDTGRHEVSGVSISGDNTMTISGHSLIDSRHIRGTASLVFVSDGGHAVFGDSAETDIYGQVRNTGVFWYHAIAYAEGTGSEIENKGKINASDGLEIMKASSGALIKNSGEINVTPGGNTTARSSIMYASGDGAQAVNMSGGTITLTSTAIPTVASGNYEFPMVWYFGVDYALLATKNGTVINEAGATINLHGAGNYGVSASQGTATNAGEINVDGFIPTVDENGNIISETYWAAPSVSLMGGGILAGSTDKNIGDAKGLNTGTINVKNEGFGLLAMDGGTVVNQGTINLNADEGVTKQHENQLFGMGAVSGGIAINDEMGVININTDVGQAFYNDGTGSVINYGTICTFGVCQGSTEYNSSDAFVTNGYSGGDILSAEGQTLTFSKNVLIGGWTPGAVTNAGNVSGNAITISDGQLDNMSTGIITNSIILDGGLFNNAGVINSLTQKQGTTNNTGTVNSRAIVSGGVVNNQQGGSVKSGAKLTGEAVFNNDGDFYLGNSSSGSNAAMLEINNNAVFSNAGEFVLDNSKNAVHLNQSGTLYNTGHMSLTNSSNNGAINMWGSNGRFVNDGIVDSTAKSVVVSASNAGSSDAFFWNQDDGVINFDHDSASAVKFTHSNFVAQNDGTMNISGNNAIAMEGNNNAQLVNNGTINLGTEGTADTGMIGMQLDSSATADAVIENNGTINIYANNSFAFSMLGANGHVVNNGTVVIADGVTGSGLIKQGDSVNVEGVNGNNGNTTEVHYGDYTLPDVPNTTVTSFVDNSSGEEGTTNNLNGYVVGTNADGSAGRLMVNNASMNGVEINTGFAAGTAETTVNFDNVVQGSNLTNADAISSTSVVWNAQGSTDATGNVDVTMSKNAYSDVATDGSVNDVAKALDAGYTNNELYTSLNVGTTAELNSALKQISGSQATTVFREARVLSNRFSMLADAAPKMGNGLAFNVVAKGDPRAELGNNTEYDMLALRKTLDLSESQSMSMEYGIARLDGDGAQKAGDNGVTGGYSQFFGLKHQMSFDNGMSWNNALRYDIHQLDSSRSVAYNDVSKTADTNVKQQYLEFRSEGAKTFEPREGLKITPYTGVKLRHTLEGGYQERNAGDFNLNMNSGSETAVDSIVGLKLGYEGKDGWSANATLEGGPNLSYAKSQRTASLAGAGSQHFNVDDGQKGGGINSLASVGVKYSSKESSLNLDAYHWKEDGLSDKGVMLNFKKTF
jgi:putative surface-exposed virulence protein